MHKEYGHLVPETDLYKDAEELGYDDITDPCSVEYGNFNLYYEKTNMTVKWPSFPLTILDVIHLITGIAISFLFWYNKTIEKGLKKIPNWEENGHDTVWRKMLDANKVFFAEIIDNFNSKKVYYNSTLIVEFLPEMKIPHINFDYKTHEEAISKLNQLTTLINLQRK